MSVASTSKAMLSLAFRTNFKNLSGLVSKSEATNSLLQFITFQRTVCTSRILQSKHAKLQEFFEQNMHERLYTGKDSKNFGKTIVLDPSEIEEDDEPVDHKYFNKSRSEKKRKGKKGSLSFKEKQAIKSQESVLNNNIEEVDDDDDDVNGHKIEYETLKSNSPLLCSTITNLKSRKRKEKFNKILIEGRKLVHEAVEAGCEPEIVFFSRVRDVKNLNLPKSTALYKVPYKDLQLWSDVETSQGIIGVLKKPNLKFEEDNINSLPLTVICDNIREPGNLGAVLRIATSAGCRKIILTQGCVDLWSLKVLRAGAGAHFRLPLLKSLTWAEIEYEVPEGSKIIVAESLKEPVNEQMKNDDSVEEKRVTTHQLPSFCYYSQTYPKENTVIVIGGEAHGISGEALQFATERKGIKVHIPMSNNIESLNCGAAFAIISYEIKRQMENATETESQVENTEKESKVDQESTSVQSE